MADIRINDLPLEANPANSEYLAIDGASTRKATVQKIVDSGAPVASQADAETGSNNTKRMTPLATKQSIASEVGVSVASQANGALAASSVQPGRQIIAGAGLIGGGDLSSDRTLNVGAGTGIDVTADAVGLDTVTQSRLIPSGGNTGQVLSKTSASDYAVQWSSSGSGDVVGPNGGTSANNLAVFTGTTGKLIDKAPNNIIGNSLLSTVATSTFKGRISSGTGNVEDLTVSQANQILGGWEPIGYINMTGQTVFVINSLSSWAMIRCTYNFVVASTQGVLLQFSINNGSSWLTSTSDYFYILTQTAWNGTTSTVTGVSGDIAGISLGEEATGGVVTISSFNKSRTCQSTSTQSIDTTSLRVARNISQRTIGTTARNAIRIIGSSGSAINGEFFFEGIRG